MTDEQKREALKAAGWSQQFDDDGLERWREVSVDMQDHNLDAAWKHHHRNQAKMITPELRPLRWKQAVANMRQAEIIASNDVTEKVLDTAATNLFALHIATGMLIEDIVAEVQARLDSYKAEWDASVVGSEDEEEPTQ